MKKNLMLVALGLLLALPGACTCDGGAKDTKPNAEAKKDTTKKDTAKPEATPEATPEANKEAAPAEGSQEGATEEAAGDKEMAEGSGEGAEGSEEGATEEGAAEEGAAEGSEESAEGTEEGSEEGAEEGSEEGAEEGSEESAEGAEEGAEESEDGKVEPPEAAENEGAGEPAQIKDPQFPEMEAGQVYAGPPTKAIKGTWKVVLPTEEYLKTLPSSDAERYQAYEGMTLKFDGKNAAFQTKEKKSSVQYKVEAEEGLTLMLAVSGDLTGTMTFTFLDEDTVLFQTLDLPTFIRARRAGK